MHPMASDRSDQRLQQLICPGARRGRGDHPSLGASHAPQLFGDNVGDRESALGGGRGAVGAVAWEELQLVQQRSSGAAVPGRGGGDVLLLLVGWWFVRCFCLNWWFFGGV